MKLENQIPTCTIKALKFSIYNPEEIKKLSVLEITNDERFDNLGHPAIGGLYDPRLGSTEKNEQCETCGERSFNCMGHLGHITLPLVVFNPLFITDAFDLLKAICMHCKQLRCSRIANILLSSQLKALQYGLVLTADEMGAVTGELIANEDDQRSTAFQLKLQRELDYLLNRDLQGGDLELAKQDAEVKNVAEYRQRLIKKFRENHILKATRICSSCKTAKNVLMLEQKTRIIMKKGKDKKIHMKKRNDPRSEESEEEDEMVESGQSYLTPLMAKSYLTDVYENEKALLSQLYSPLIGSDGQSSSPIDGFFIQVLPVPPPRFRPVSFMNGQKYDHAHSNLLGEVIKECYVIQNLVCAQKNNSFVIPDSIKVIIEKLPGATWQEKLQLSWNKLQQRVNSIFDGELKNSLQDNQLPGIKQLLEKKEGLMRMHMLGKRVNFAARSVISPDPYIDVNEIGIPTIFATKLTYPEMINRHNAAELKQAVINGPNVHPGAIGYSEDGRNKSLLLLSKEQRQQVANKLFSQIDECSLTGSKIVERHLKDGDMLLLNRQPTLHKPSIMAHKARVLKGEKTLRLNYSACKTYNADFDGDEMNCHFPQSEAAKAEAYLIANVENQYLVPKDGTPLGGLIQDHIIGATKLMVRGRFLNREDYQQLVYSAVSNKKGNILLLPPAIVKPCCLWSGKQVVSTILINVVPPDKNSINLIGNSKIADKYWLRNVPRKWKAGGSPLKENNMTENEVIIRQGEILSGILDKNHCGPTPYGLVHCCYELYGGEVAALLLSQLERVFTVYLQFSGFSLGVEDIIVVPKADGKRREFMNTTEELDYSVMREALKLPEDADIEAIEDQYSRVHLSGDEKAMKDIDSTIKSKTDIINNDINKVCLPNGLLKKFPDNSLQLMVISGAKGSSVNCMQISGLLGQIELEGRRPPLMLSGRSLPSFPPYSTLTRAGGFVYGRFLSGIRPQEYYFHCMAGREGLIDTAVKTSRSGYLQRCLIKHLEGLTVVYDMTVRDSDGSVIQLQYGEDGLDIGKLQFLNPKQLPFLVENHKSILDEEVIAGPKNDENYSDVLRYSKKVRKWLKSRSEKVPRFNGFLKFCKKLKKEGFQIENSKQNKDKLLEAWFDLEQSERASYNLKAKRTFDPVASVYRIDTHFGAITEKLDAIVEDYIAIKIGNFSADKFRDILHYKCQKAICSPGESVGLLAAQSIGEPSTQMTLNTFHFAGRGEMNVTLGIPRLREILMTGSANISTPSMEVPVLGTCDESITDNGEILKKRLSRIYLSDVLLDTSVHERSNFNSDHKDRTYIVRFTFLPRKLYRKRLDIKPSKILAYMEATFFKALSAEIKKHEKALSKSTLLHTAALAKERAGGKEDDKEENEDEAVIEPSAERQSDEISSDEEVVDDENGATEQRNRQRRQQDREYEVDDDEEEIMAENNSDNDEEDGESTTKRNVSQSSNEIEMESENENEVNEEEINEAPQIDESVAVRIKTVLGFRYVYNYKYDIKKQEWCELTLKMDIAGVPRLNIDEILAAQVKKAIVNHVPGIKKAFMADQEKADQTREKILKTDGINIKEMFKYVNMVDLKRLYSNDIHAMAQTYGIEAAARVIVKEVKNVFKVYGIEVDPRHLLLVADYMTFDGFYKAFSRRGMENSVSPLQQMSFETTMKFLKAATLAGTSDRLHNPSSRLVMGRPVGCGTGCFSLLHPIKATPGSL